MIPWWWGKYYLWIMSILNSLSTILSKWKNQEQPFSCFRVFTIWSGARQQEEGGRQLVESTKNQIAHRWAISQLTRGAVAGHEFWPCSLSWGHGSKEWRWRRKGRGSPSQQLVRKRSWRWLEDLQKDGAWDSAPNGTCTVARQHVRPPPGSDLCTVLYGLVS